MSHFLLTPDVVERLGWLLVHSIWQFALIALVALMLERAMQRTSAAARYGVLLGALGMMLAAPGITWLVLPYENQDAQASMAESPGIVASEFRPHVTVDQPSLAGFAATDAPLTESSPIAPWPSEQLPSEQPIEPALAATTPGLATWWSWITHALRPWLNSLVIAWCVGVLAFALRPILSWYTVQRLRTVGVSPVPDALSQLLRGAAGRLRIRSAVALLQSTPVHVPCVVGYFRPVILLPVSVVSGFPPDQLEAILVHELAHIRRHDYLVNLVQTLVETVFFYHPAIWWLSHRIRCERENCCDDMVVALLGNKVEYGRTLLALEQRRSAATALAVGAGGGSLLDRSDGCLASRRQTGWLAAEALSD